MRVIVQFSVVAHGQSRPAVRSDAGLTCIRVRVRVLWIVGVTDVDRDECISGFIIEFD